VAAAIRELPARGHLEDTLLVTSFEGLRHLHQHFTTSIRLRQEGHIQRCEPMLRQDLGWVSRHVENGLIGPLLQYLTTRSHPITIRHDYIDHDEVDPPMSETQHIEGFATRVGFEDPKALFREDPISDSA